MSKKSISDDSGDLNETSEATLAALTTQISEFVHEGTLDSRCAAKLVKRLKKEAEAILECSKAAKTGQEELKKAFDAVDAALRNHDAGLLVTANAVLRSTDDLAGDKRPE
ncbi:hypothetical protein [Paraburkholderia sp. GAS348]|uniref:hypothetical protein n=1 Tax=Paraburkholderia sp. GAS348 TaxID=3035132 RepID=UPI003D1910EF